jgi:hypothetical protein
MPFDPARLPWLASVLFVAASGLGCASERPMQYPLSAARVALAAPASLVAQPGQDGNTSEVRSVFGEWVSARSRGDRAAYEALYDAKRFEGVRRARSGIEKRLTWSEWVTEQQPAVDRAEARRVLQPVFESWPGGTLDLATASVAFLEESGPTAATRSIELVQRVLVFGRGADGKLRVVREELGVAGSAAPSNTLSRDAKVARALEN